MPTGSLPVKSTTTASPFSFLSSPKSNFASNSGVSFTTATSVSLTGSTTYDKIKSAGAVKVGVKADQPGLGYKDAQGNRCGFDIEFARLIASKILRDDGPASGLTFTEEEVGKPFAK